MKNEIISSLPNIITASNVASIIKKLDTVKDLLNTIAKTCDDFKEFLEKSDTPSYVKPMLKPIIVATNFVKKIAESPTTYKILDVMTSSNFNFAVNALVAGLLISTAAVAPPVIGVIAGVAATAFAVKGIMQVQKVYEVRKERDIHAKSSKALHDLDLLQQELKKEGISDKQKQKIEDFLKKYQAKSDPEMKKASIAKNVVRGMIYSSAENFYTITSAVLNFSSVGVFGAISAALTAGLTFRSNTQQYHAFAKSKAELKHDNRCNLAKLGLDKKANPEDIRQMHRELKLLLHEVNPQYAKPKDNPKPLPGFFKRVGIAIMQTAINGFSAKRSTMLADPNVVYDIQKHRDKRAAATVEQNVKDTLATEQNIQAEQNIANPKSTELNQEPPQEIKQLWASKKNIVNRNKGGIELRRGS